MTNVPSLAALRADFPALRTTMRGRELIYFDNGATSLKPQPVIDAIDTYYRECSANIHRGVYELSERATVAYDDARATMRRFIGCDPEVGEVVFTRGTTESINLVAYAWGMHRLEPGDEIVVSPLEHHSNLVPWQQVARRTGATLKFLPLTADAIVTENAVMETITGNTRLVAITGMSNVTGHVPPLRTIIDVAHSRGALTLVDGAQYVSHGPVDVRELDCDFLAFSGHKMCGPTGIGVLYARRALLEEMEPFHYGGDMIQEVTLEGATWAQIPEKFEAGTPNIAGAIGIAAAAEYLAAVGMDHVARHERALSQYLEEVLGRLPYIRRYGSAGASERGGIFSFGVEGVHPHDVGSLLDQQGIAVRTGFHCAQPLMRHFCIPGTVRASLYLYNTEEEIDRFATAVERLYSVLA
jgi:cysteine desulfurase / selenocysteine lyase